MDPKKVCTLFLLFLFSCSHPHTVSGEPDDSDTKTYIIQIKHPVEEPHLDVHHPESMETWYTTLLDNIPGVTSRTSENEPRIIHSYTHAMSGFAAKLTDNELEAVKKQDWFAHAYPNLVYTPQTTHSPQFLGLNPDAGLWKNSNYGEGMIIGVVDSGIALGHPSFNDEGLPPPPAKWKGSCEHPFVCNNKIIGVKSHIKGKSPTDETGHGTHTASTAGGVWVKNAAESGAATGTAVGMAPRAHLAIYKVCDQEGCESISLVAGIGAAIRDGCDVISLSLSSRDQSLPLYEKAGYVATFSAIKRDIFISASAGNSGPAPSTVANTLPWMLTVGASTMDRITNVATVKLGSGLEIEGVSSLQSRDFGTELRPLVYAGQYNYLNVNASMCADHAFDGVDVRGKIVACERGVVGRIEKGKNVMMAGGAGMVIMNNETNGYELISDRHVLPASVVNYVDGNKIKAYINSTNNPTATILFKGTIMGTDRAPMVGAFSSRGPNPESPGILKPDIIGPGVDILAAWPATLTNQTGPGPGPFKLESGTSMSCPHLSGIAALIKVAHPDWPPSAVKSAIMTTAYSIDNRGGPILDDNQRLPADLFAVGAGHVNVSRAHDPGLVYKNKHNEYVRFLCGLGLTEQQVESFTNSTVKCSSLKAIVDHDLNYPSMTVTVGLPGSNVTLPRKVTNVGNPKEKYWVEVDAPPGISVVVKPTRLKFKKVNSKKKFRVTFTSTGGGSGYAEGQLKWVSKKHVVRSPISIKFN